MASAPPSLGSICSRSGCAEKGISEVVLATGVTVEGDATANLVAGMALKCGLRASRIAHGVPVGGELEFVDSGTLSRAFMGRSRMERASGEDIGI